MRLLRKISSSRSGFAVISGFVTIMASLTLFRPYWEENDDIGITLLAEGAFGSREPHLVYSNILYGRILCALQGLIPTVRWHAVIMYLFIFISSCLFIYMICDTKKGKILSVIFLACTVYEICVALQFSKVSAYIAILAYFVLFRLAGQKMASISQKAIAVTATICLVYAFILRMESFLLATMIAGCYGICLVVSELINGELREKFRSYCLLFVPVFVICGVLFAADRYSYSTGEWNEFINYFDSVAELEDYHNSSLLYDLHGEELKALGVSENDAIMYITYQSLEHRITTNDLMNRISMLDGKGIGSVNADFLKAWLANIYDEVFDLNSAFIGLVLCVAILLSATWKKTDKKYHLVIMGIQAVISVAVLFYYQYSGRWCHRVVYALVVSELILAVYLLSGTDDENIGPVRACVYAMVFVSLIYLRLGNEFSFREYERDAFKYDELVSYMEQNKENLYVADVFTMIDYDRYRIFTAARSGQFDNCLMTDSVLMANSPVNREIAARYGYTDPLEALCAGDEKVILADGLSPETELVFCKEHGSADSYRLVELDEVGGIKLYNIQ